MKKIVFICLSCFFVLTGCGKVNKEDMVSYFKDYVNNAKSYKLEGNMKIYNDEDTYSYKLEAYYLKDNYYKVILVNETNNKEQIILRNDDGVYVVTPSLNKSFKFDSVWPDNSSQSYLLGSLLKDVENDPGASYDKENDGFYIKSTVNYPNNPNLKYQKLLFDSNKNLIKTQVFNDKDEVKLEVTFNKINLKENLKPENFKLENYIDAETNSSCDKDNCDKTTSSIDEIIYPLYIPSNTYLSGSDSINNEDTQRIILTFAGDKNFVLIEENAVANEVFEVIPIYGDPLMINDTIGALSTNSVYWATGGKDYYLVSNDLSSDELINVASSINNNTTVAATK